MHDDSVALVGGDEILGLPIRTFEALGHRMFDVERFRPALEGRGEFWVVVAHVRAPGRECQFETADDDLAEFSVLAVYAKSVTAIRHAEPPG